MATVLCFQPSDHMHLIPYIAAIHASCITHDRAVATFLPPLTHDKLLKWWKDRVSEVKDGTRILYVLVKSPQAGARILGTEVAGVVMLEMPRSETGSFRGAVEKLLVHPTYRNRGGARALVEELERDASRCGRTMLTLDTETGSSGEAVFRKLGYTELGKIPNYSMSPTGELKGTTFFYKQL